MNTTTATTATTKKRTFWTIAREQLEAERALKQLSKKKFKSERAAKMAYTKAERAAKKADAVANSKEWEFRKDGWNEERFQIVRDLEAIAKKCWDEAHAIYKAARDQGFYVRSYYFGHNSTRDLIAANID